MSLKYEPSSEPLLISKSVSPLDRRRRGGGAALQLPPASRIRGSLSPRIPVTRPTIHSGGNPEANRWFLKLTPIQMLPPGGSICGRSTCCSPPLFITTSSFYILITTPFCTGLSFQIVNGTRKSCTTLVSGSIKCGVGPATSSSGRLPAAPFYHHLDPVWYGRILLCCTCGTGEPF